MTSMLLGSRMLENRGAVQEGGGKEEKRTKGYITEHLGLYLLPPTVVSRKRTLPSDDL